MKDKNAVIEDHKRLKDELMVVQRKRKRIVEMLDEPCLYDILKKFELQIESTKESLVVCEKKDMDSKQQSVLARRSLLRELRGAYEDEEKEARRQLDQFEKDHALLLQNDEDEKEESKAS